MATDPGVALSPFVARHIGPTAAEQASMLADLGLGDASLRELEAVCTFACRPGSDLHHLPFPVEPTDLLAALVSTTAIGEGAAASRQG